MPLPGARMIPTGWSEHHQGVVVTSMNGRVKITDPSRTTPGVWDPVEMTYGPSTEHVVYASTPARIQQLDTDRQVDQAEQTIGIHRYLVQLPADRTDLQVGYRLEVLEVTSDQDLMPVGTVLRVADVPMGSEGFTRDVIAEHNQQPVGGA